MALVGVLSLSGVHMGHFLDGEFDGVDTGVNEIGKKYGWGAFIFAVKSILE